MKLLTVVAAMAAISAFAMKIEPIQLAGVTCQTPPPLHCPDADCPGPMVIEQGTAVEPKTGRKFFLDYPCDLKRGEKVTFILSLHGFGSYGNWQRHYFPLMDYKEKYRLVIATPNSPTKFWAESDDEYLHNIVDMVFEQVGRKNIKAFWLVGHSQGGLTFEPAGPHRLFQGQGRRLAEPVGRTVGRQSWSRWFRSARWSAAGNWRTCERDSIHRRIDGGPARTSVQRFFVHL